MDTYVWNLMILNVKKLLMLIKNSRKYNPDMLFLLYYPSHVTSFQIIDCKKQASIVFLLKIHPVTQVTKFCHITHNFFQPFFKLTQFWRTKT